MAYIRKRGKTWSYTVEGPKDPVTNERDQITKGGFKRKSDADLAASKLEIEIADGTFVKDSKISFGEYSNQWLRWYSAGVISKKPKLSSVRQRTYQVDSLLLHFNSIIIGKITRNQYQDVLLKMKESMATNTVKGIHGTARMIFRKAIQDGVIKTNPTDYTRVPADLEDEEDETPKYMEKEELAEFLNLAKSRGTDNYYHIYLLLAYTGMRVGELCVLKWSDINFDEFTISVNGTLYNPYDLTHSYTITSPKTKTSRRVVEVDDMILAELAKIKSQQNEFKMLHRNTWHDGDFVFARMDKPRNAKRTVYGYPLVRRTIERRMNVLMQWMNTSVKYTPHSLRHTHTSLCAEAGVSLEAIMQRLGHKDDRTTRLVYLHATQTVKREAAAKFGALMSNVIKM
ncbi:MAG TPA: site-specific integrase [Candidatus Paenibacillus intestinavium]|nr:site-specific integrase [Candidatus Paenibacillus intestinavium]